MEIRRELVPTSTLEEFADEHGLVMVVVERDKMLVDLPHIGKTRKFYATFDGADIKGDGVLIGAFGSGPNEEEAIARYGDRISEETLVVDAAKEFRREIKVPRITGAR